MKKYLFCILAALAACQEEDEPLPAVDPFVGSWHLQNIQYGLNVSFDIEQEGEDLEFRNILVDYPEIPDSETLNYHMELSYRYPVNVGCKQMKIFGSGDQVWIILTMNHNAIHLKSRNKLDVYQMQIEMVNRDPIILQNQVFTRAN